LKVQVPRKLLPNNVQLSGQYDRNNIAFIQDVGRYAAKGSWLGCLVDATDGDAGKAWPDPWNRTPKSATSRWSGTLESRCGSYIGYIN
jgi:hypothetical protein